MIGLLTDSVLVFGLKLGCSLDDLIWLPVWLVSRRPAAVATVCVIYLLTVMGLAAVALWLAEASRWVLGALGWAEGLIGIVGGMGLLIMAWREWREEKIGDGAEQAGTAVRNAPGHAARERTVVLALVGRVFWVSVLGSLDELGAYTVSIVGMGFSLPPVMLGTFAGTCLVLMLALGLGQLSATRGVLLQIPEWCVLALLGGLAMGAGAMSMV